MAGYESEWRSALADVQGAHGPAVALTPPASSTDAVIEGFAFRDIGNPAVYADLNLIETDAPALFFVPSAYAVYPSALGYSVVWAGTTYIVRASNPFAPSGEWIFAKLVVST